MNNLILEWQEKPIGRIKTQKICDIDSSKHPGSTRLGRSPDLCDIVFPWDEKISRLHAEIFFNSEQNSFYLRKLPEGRRPAIVDGKIVMDDEAPLREGSKITLAETEIKVVEVFLTLTSAKARRILNVVATWAKAALRNFLFLFRQVDNY
ncbi:FHA domain-containing protein [Scytonema sp. UIC 10036]|uniref:FHA domain-containing protein n=1 Tax=Scytonema sp. UIC 10036 TaxID=2304196 RepID=UPI0012DACFEC|nr:FHA domain-containing protein [Scytonema sp. UIC 10036]MUG98475.1 FHA domain-containing protein [Scytonema sp. UIC 10036]